MPSFKIVIVATNDGVYTAKDLKEAQEIAEQECDDAWNGLRGRYDVDIISVEEVPE